MVKPISREELKEKVDKGEDLVLVDTMAERYYRHSHLPGALHLPVDNVRTPREKLRRKPPVNWRRWAIRTCGTTSGARKTG